MMMKEVVPVVRKVAVVLKKVTVQAVSDVLRRKHFAFLLIPAAEVSESERGDCVNCTSKTAMSAGGSAKRGDAVNVDISDGLMLYYDKFSFYSQKVVLALHEKNLHFESRIINLIKHEQYSSWFLNLNPKGEVPVLQDTGKIIPDSGRIIDYLEDNFSNGDTPRLIPMDQGPEIRQKVTHFRHVLQQVPAGAVTTGSVLNSQLLRNPRFPFISVIRNAIANDAKNAGAKLREYAEKNSEASAMLLKKAQDRETEYTELCVEKNFNAILSDLDKKFEEVETELARNSTLSGRENWWLCSDRFTIADVELTILLERLSQLGLSYYFWSDGKRPHVEKYYQRVRERDSYKKTVPGKLAFLKVVFASSSLPIAIGVAVTVVALIIGGVFIGKKYV